MCIRLRFFSSNRSKERNKTRKYFLHFFFFAIFFVVASQFYRWVFSSVNHWVPSYLGPTHQISIKIPFWLGFRARTSYTPSIRKQNAWRCTTISSSSSSFPLYRSLFYFHSFFGFSRMKTRKKSIYNNANFHWEKCLCSKGWKAPGPGRA